jgi:hypothetical protein
VPSLEKRISVTPEPGAGSVAERDRLTIRVVVLVAAAPLLMSTAVLFTELRGMGSPQKSTSGMMHMVTRDRIKPLDSARAPVADHDIGTTYIRIRPTGCRA